MRIIDLSYAAAVKLDIHRRGTGRVEVRALQPGEALAAAPRATPRATAAQASGIDALVGRLPPPPAAAPVVASPSLTG